MTKFTTVSGSHYTLDTVNKKWYRPSNENSLSVRTSGGDYTVVSEIKVGEPVIIVCPPLVEQALARFITTSEVAMIHEEANV